MLPIGHQAEEMERFCVVWGKFEGLPVRRFCFRETTGLLVRASLFEPGVDLPGRALVSSRFLTASLGSIHDASATGLRVAEKRPTGQSGGSGAVMCDGGLKKWSRDEDHKIGRLSGI
jgi:hypothetical protein